MQVLRINVLFLLLTSVLLSGCEFKDVELERVERFEIIKLDQGKLDGVLTVQLTNPNSFPITIKEGEFKLYSGKTEVGDARLSSPLKIQANSTQSYEVEMNGTMGDILSAGVSSLLGMLSGKSPELTIKGELKAGNFFYSKKVPVELTTDLPLDF
jgi:LEA14-like dessication related protein